MAKKQKWLFEVKGEGDQFGDIEQALEETLKRLRNGNHAGFDSHDTGEFQYRCWIPIGRTKVVKCKKCKQSIL